MALPRQHGGEADVHLAQAQIAFLREKRDIPRERLGRIRPKLWKRGVYWTFICCYGNSSRCVLSLIILFT